jgi:hypothetical protein
LDSFEVTNDRFKIGLQEILADVGDELTFAEEKGAGALCEGLENL